VQSCWHQDKADVVSCLVLGTSYLTHPRRRTSKSHGVDPVPLSLSLPRAASSAIVSSLTPSPLYSLSEHQSCSLPSTTQLGSLQQISIHAAITPPTPSKHSSRAVPPCTHSKPVPYLLSPSQPLSTFHMPLTKAGPSSGRNSPGHKGFRHPFGGRVSKHFGDMVRTLPKTPAWSK
jgi:hypothetical protein